MQSYLGLEKNRRISGDQSCTDTGSEEEYNSEMKGLLMRSQVKHKVFFSVPFLLQTTQILRITRFQVHLWWILWSSFYKWQFELQEKGGVSSNISQGSRRAQKEKTQEFWYWNTLLQHFYHISACLLRCLTEPNHHNLLREERKHTGRLSGIS